MATKNPLLQAPPYAVEKALARLGANLRTARIRRRLTIKDVAQRTGTGRRAVMNAEKGKASSAVAIYAALLWAYDLLEPVNDLANPATDEQGLALIAARGKTRVRKSRGLDNEF